MKQKCRFCENIVSKFISFGKMPIANAFLKQDQFKNEYFFELAPTYCKNCSLFQLLYQPNPKLLFHENYAFFANTSEYMQEHFKNLSTKLIQDCRDSENGVIMKLL